MENDNKLPAENSKPLIESLKDYWPLFTIYLIALGYLESVGYYTIFSINILPYLDFTDIFQIQFKFYAFLNIYLAGLIAGILLLYEMSKYKEPESKKSIFKIIADSILKSNLAIKIFYIASALLFGISICPYIGRLEAIPIHQGKVINEAILILENQTIKTDKTNIFIG